MVNQDNHFGPLMNFPTDQNFRIHKTLQQPSLYPTPPHRQHADYAFSRPNMAFAWA